MENEAMASIPSRSASAMGHMVGKMEGRAIAEPITFTVLGKPGAKARPRFSRKSGVAYTPKATRTLEAIIAMTATDARGDKPLLTGPVKVLVTAQFSPPVSWSKRKQSDALSGAIQPTGRPDGDNVLKAVTDACNGILYVDDSQITEMTVVKQYGAEAMTIVKVEAVT